MKVNCCVPNICTQVQRHGKQIASIFISQAALAPMRRWKQTDNKSTVSPQSSSRHMSGLQSYCVCTIRTNGDDDDVRFGQSNPGCLEWWPLRSYRWREHTAECRHSPAMITFNCSSPRAPIHSSRIAPFVWIAFNRLLSTRSSPNDHHRALYMILTSSTNKYITKQSHIIKSLTTLQWHTKRHSLARDRSDHIHTI